MRLELLSPKPLLLPSCLFPEWNIREQKQQLLAPQLRRSPLHPAGLLASLSDEQEGDEQEGDVGLLVGGRSSAGGLGCHRGRQLFYPGKDGREGKRHLQVPVVSRCALGFS